MGFGSRAIAIALTAVWTCGCASKPQDDAPPIGHTSIFTGQLQPTVPQQADTHPVMALDQHPDAVETSRNAAPAVHELFRVDIYQITVPFGTISGNMDFWRRIDEQCIDVATYDLLYKNGIRVGEAPLAEIDHLQKFMEIGNNCRLTSITGVNSKGSELEQQRDMMEQTIMYYDGENRLWGRSYDRSANVVNVGFTPTPRKPGYIRLELCPVVRTSRKRLEFTILNDERELKYVQPEALYDLNLRTDIPTGSFMIVAPSPDAKRQTSVGHAFFTREGDTSLLEQILIIVPRTFAMDEKGVYLPMSGPPGSGNTAVPLSGQPAQSSPLAGHAGAR